MKLKNLPPAFNTDKFLDVYFLESDPKFGWVCGFKGTVLRTTDSGATWKGVRIPLVDQLESINFTDSKNGYTSGPTNISNDGAIFKTTDGGATWINVSPINPGQLWGNLFYDADHGMVIGGGCGGIQNFYRTTNGGRDWSLFEGNAPNSGLTDLALYNPAGLGYATSSGLIWKTVDGGKSWSIFSVSGTSDWQEDINIFGNSIIVPVSSGCDGNGGVGGVRMSTDMGKSWNELSGVRPMFGTFLHDELRAWGVGFNRDVYYTSDGGVTWEKKNCGIENDDSLDDLWFLNDSTGFLVGDGIYKYKKLNIGKPVILVSNSGVSCEGDTVLLSVDKVYEEYRWSTKEITPTIKVTKSGTYSFFGYNNDCDSGSAKAVDIQFKPRQPITISSNAPKALCDGDSATLTVNENFTSYKWVTGEITKSIIVKKSGKYKVVGTDINGCTNSAEFEILFNPNPDPKILVTGKTDFCVGDTVFLNLNAMYDFVSWRDENGKEIAVNVSGIVVTHTGKFSVYARNNTGCDGQSDTVSISVRDETNTFDLSIYATDEVFIDSVYYPLLSCREIVIKNIGSRDTVISDPYITGNIAFSIPQSQLPIRIGAGDSAKLVICYSPSEIDLQRDTLIIGDICSPHIVRLKALGLGDEFTGTSRCGVGVTLKTTGINQYYKYNVSSPYPNPAKGIVRIEFSAEGGNSNMPVVKAEIVDNLGIERSRGTIDMLSSSSSNSLMKVAGNVSFDTNELTSGIYWAVIDFDGQRTVMALVVSK